MQTEWSFPTMNCRWIEPDILLLKSTLTVASSKDAETMRLVMPLILELIERTPYLYVVCDLGSPDVPGLSTEGREALREFKIDKPFTAVIFGGSVATRALTSLIVRALNLLGKTKTLVSVAKNEADAMAWVEHDRQRRRVAA